MDDVLPGLAREGAWVVRADHCFGRILLDHAVEACWYDVLDRRRSAGPAYRQLDDAQLARAVELGRRVVDDGDPLLRELNARSLRWRGKPDRRRSSDRIQATDGAAEGSASPRGTGTGSASSRGTGTAA